MSGQVSQQQAIGAGGLNAQLDHLEILISKLEPKAGKSVLAILYEMDAIEAQLKELRLSGASIKAEESQFETSCAVLRKQAPVFVRAVGGVQMLQEERSRRNPPGEAWWWYLDEIYRQQRFSALKKTLSALVIAAAVIAVLAVVYQKFLAPSPDVVARYNAIQQSTQLTVDGKYDEALAAVQAGLAVLPGDPDLLLMEGVILQVQGKLAQAADVFGQARQKIGNELNFYLGRSQDYNSIGKNDLAVADAQAAVALDPNSAAGYYLLGSAQEAQKQVSQALTSYQKAVELADAQGLTNLTAEIKLKMGYLMQAAGAALPMFGVTPTP
jgi:tetratricopeptide (TPR) repeat protein